MGALTLILGGARAGKTAFAQQLAARQAGPVAYVATAEALDDEMAVRIARHRAERPPHWLTVEAPRGVAAALAAAPPTSMMVLDCLTVLTSNLLLASATSDPPTQAEADGADAAVATELDALLSWLKHSTADLVVVSNEVGLGVVPPTALGRLYRDVLGRANQRLAARADRVYLLIAGLALDLTAAGAQPYTSLAAQLPQQSQTAGRPTPVS